ncbi:MAG: hypothetical protein PHQ98_03245 [Candidatus ainarchaeum sp.]|nr:hypothetical protein [Candidatus ainarchaeum sp.]
MGLKDFYYLMEDKWYKFVDKFGLDPIVDKIDNVVPSFVLFIVLILTVLLLIGILLFSQFPITQQMATVNLTVKDLSDEYVTNQNIVLNVLKDGEITNSFTGKTSAQGYAVFTNIPLDSEVNVIVNLANGTKINETFIVDELNFSKTIKAKSNSFSAYKMYTVTLKKPETYSVYTDTTTVNFSCSNSSVSPNPISGVTRYGSIDVNMPDGCNTLYASVSIPEYKEKRIIVNGNNSKVDFLLEANETLKSKLIVNIRNDGSAVSGANFDVIITASNGEKQTKSTSSSTVEFEVNPDIYTVAVSETNNNYSSAYQTDVSVPFGKIITQSMNVSKEIKARIKVTVQNSTNNSLITGAKVTLKSSTGNVISQKDTNSNGIIEFAIFDLGSYKVTAKKEGDIGVGYFAKEIDLNNLAIGTTAVTLKLDLITTSNSGKVITQVVDQEDEPVANAKVFFKYADDSLVELNESIGDNYLLTDTNGKIFTRLPNETKPVYAYAVKNPKNGKSESKKIVLTEENLFNVKMNLGYTDIEVYATDEEGKKVNGEMKIYDNADNEVSNAILIENGVGKIKVKSGKYVYIVIKGDEFENYATEEFFLNSGEKKRVDVLLLTNIIEPAIDFNGIYNSNGTVANYLNPTETYSAKFYLTADKSYNQIEMYFRAGKETLMENDYIQITGIDASGISDEARGTSYFNDNAKDIQYLTDSLAKWINVGFDNFGVGRRVVKVNFRIKENVPVDEELTFYWSAKFDGIRLPDDNNELFGKYFVGGDGYCEDAFCLRGEKFYDRDELLYITSPYSLSGSKIYDYSFLITNNSDVLYGIDAKKLYMDMEVIGSDGQGAKILSYELKSPSLNTILVSDTKAFTKINNLEIPSMPKFTSITANFVLEGNKTGNNLIKITLKSDGEKVFTKEINFSVPTESEMTALIDPTFIPSLSNTLLEVTTKDKQNELIPNAKVEVYAKQAGYDEYLVDRKYTSNLGVAEVYTGSHYPSTKIYIDVSKADYSRKRYALTVSENIVEYNPSEIGVSLNTVSKREVTESVGIGNKTKELISITGIKLDAPFSGIINESALTAYIEQFIGTELEASDSDTFDLIKMRLDNAIGQDYVGTNDISGNVIINYKLGSTNLIYDTTIPLNVNISSSASTSEACIKIENAVQEETTQMGRIIYRFEITNACESEGTGIDIEELYVKANGELNGTADISVQSGSSSTSARSALDNSKRKLLSGFKAGEKLFGSITYVPSNEAIGESVPINVTIEGKFQDQTIGTVPSTLDFTANVLNLKECVSISSTSSPVAFDETSTVTVDASGCLGENIQFVLCKDDSGCSGFTEGTVSLSDKDFTIKGESKEIDVSSPTLPGTYGVTVWARLANKSSGFTYVGEVPVSFKAKDGKYFYLSKTELSLLGEGTSDVVLLENRMLMQDVKVKADECVWGEEDAGFDWAKGLAGAMMGATIGSMIGSSFSPTQKEGETKTTEKEVETSGESKTVDGRISELNTKQNSSTGLTASEATELSKLNNMKSSLDIAIDDMEIGSSPAYIYSDSSGNITQYSSKVIGKGDYLGAVSYDAATKSYVFDTPSTSAKYYNASNGELSNLKSGILNTYGDKSWISITADNLNNRATAKNGSLKSVSIQDKFQKLSFSSNEPVYKKLSFFNYVQGSFTLVGAIAGAIIMGFSDSYKCADNDRIVPFQDFTVFLQGQTQEVELVDGTTESKVIPSDALPLSFTLGGITANWDFTDADYSNIENVAIKFDNASLNEPRAKYGVLTVAANVHQHGTSPLIPVGADATTVLNTSTEDAFDVTCNNSNFSNYWIGSDENSGACTPIMKNPPYTQKFHMRVITGYPEEEGAKIKKSISCYNGSLSGSTGEAALPAVKFKWGWNDIAINECDYGNPNSIYCDGTQFTISVVKKLAKLEEFFSLNNDLTCPENPIYSDIQEQMEEVNSVTEIVAANRAGVSNITNILVAGDSLTATVIVENNTGASLTTNMAIAVKGQGEPEQQLLTVTLENGENEIELSEIGVPKYNGIYFITAVVNGDGGNRKAVTKAFENPMNTTDCWALKSTQRVGGLPSIMYYLANADQIEWTTDIPNADTLYSYINFSSYLIKENYSENFFKDFKNYYTNNLLQGPTDAFEQKVLAYLDSGKYGLNRRFTNYTDVEAGLYDIFLDIDFSDEFEIIDTGTNIDLSVLLIKTPTVMYPFYSMPFDGKVGLTNGRLDYGVEYLLASGSEEINISNDVSTHPLAAGNGYIKTNVQLLNNFELVNSSLGTRGQLASFNYNGSTARISFSPNFATPIISKFTLNGTSGSMRYTVEKVNGGLVTTGNSMNYWTGAAKSKDFYGANANEVYNNTADYYIQEDNEYGFDYQDATNNGNLYLKTIIYTPTMNSYVIKSANPETLFWTANADFSQVNSLNGVSGIELNNGLGVQNITQLFDLVRNTDVCITNDETTLSFWWNPERIANISGNNNAQEAKELTLIGQ